MCFHLAPLSLYMGGAPPPGSEFSGKYSSCPGGAWARGGTGETEPHQGLTQQQVGRWHDKATSAPLFHFPKNVVALLRRLRHPFVFFSQCAPGAVAPSKK